MAQDTEYAPIEYVYQSAGLVAREIVDQAPPYTYLQNLNCLEREEKAMSSRYGTTIINRDPDGTVGGVNYFFSSPVTSIARLTYQNAAFRYAGLGDGTLHRRAGNTQGAYTQIYSGLSGNTFQWLVANCFETSQAYLFIYDGNTSIKDVGTGTPQLTGIDPPPYTANALPYSPLLTLIDDFASGNAYTSSGFSSPWTYATIGSVPVNSGAMVTDFPAFLGGTTITNGAMNADVTLTIPPSGSNWTSETAYGFPSTPISAGESVTVSINDASATFGLTGTAAGSGMVQFQYSINNGTTWVTFFSQSFTAPGTYAIGTVSVIVAGIGNLNTLQYRIYSTANGTTGAGNVTMNAGCATSTVAVAVAGELADISNGMLSVLSESGTSVSTSSTIYATQYATNISPPMPSTSYEFNSNQIRTKGSVGFPILTEYVIATGFNLGIPNSATITGIKATLNWLGQHAGTGIITNAALYYSNAIYGTEQHPGTANQSFSANADVGGPGFLWGAAPTPSIVNDPSFGIGFQVTTEQVGSTDRSFFNSWTITVYYSTSGGGGGATTLTQVPIASINSSGWDGSKYTTLTIVTGTPHGISPSSNVSVYGCTNDLCDGFYAATVVDATTVTVPFTSVSALSATGGTLSYYPGQIPDVAMIGNIYSTPYPPQLSAFGFYQQVPIGATTFPIGNWSGTVAASSTATVGVTAGFDLSINNQVNDADLIVLTLKVDDPNNISNIRLQFDVNGSGYTSSYYYANIAPAYYQANVANQIGAYETTQSQIFADTLGLITGQPISTTTAQLQPSNISTGGGAWAAVYIPRGNFLPVGTAGQSGLDWNNITGWQLQIETTSDGPATVACNGLYLQWGYGPSSFAGTGYEYRYTYYDAATGTESSPSPIMQFNEQYGYLSSLAAPFYLRQAVEVIGQYSSDAQVTHLRMYRRGGTRKDNWVQIDQVPNITAGGTFYYKDVVADAAIAQAQLLVLDNDPPVTSSLVNPIQTTLSAPTAGTGQSIYSTFSPQTITVADATAVFVTNQTVLVGNVSNLEEVLVVAGGTGQFTAIVRLQHNAGEQVQVNSIPRQPCDICTEAYGVVWLAGDKNNPNYVYRAKNGFPENFSPAAYIPVGTADDPVMGLINWRGTLMIATLKTWYILANGATKPQPTGAAHGLVAKNGWTLVEGQIWFQASDGVRAFTGADGVYMTLPVEWIFRNNPLCLAPQALQSEFSESVLGFYNNCVYDSYVSTQAGNPRYRLVYDTVYRRYRYDDIQATAMFWERDTNAFLVGKEISAGNYAVVQDWTNDYDDGGWSGGALTQTPLTMTIQSPYRDLGKPHYPKQWNMLQTDVNTNDNTMQTSMLFEDGTISLALANQNTGTTRKKVQFTITGAPGQTGDGQQAYRASILHTISVLKAPILYQENVYAAVLADYNSTYDTYWIKLGTDLSKFIKQGYFDYTSPVDINCSLYADNSTNAYWTFTLPAQSQRYVQRVRFGHIDPGTTAFTMRTWRLTMNSSDPTQPFQLWKKPRIEYKTVQQGHGFLIAELEI